MNEEQQKQLAALWAESSRIQQAILNLQTAVKELNRKQDEQLLAQAKDVNSLSRSSSDQVALNNNLVALTKRLSDRITALENKKTKKSQLGDL